MSSDSVELCETEVCSCTSNLLEQMYDFQKCIMFHLKQILSPQDLLQNRSLETVPACIVLQYYPHNNTVYIHMCDEYKKINRFRRLSQPLVHFVIDRAS